MYRLSLLTILAAVVLAAPCMALAQADEQGAFDAGLAAFEQENFAEARDLFARAAELEPDSAPAFLWLGKAHYLLGDVDEAIAAWTATLRIAPDESYSKAMLTALRGQQVEVDTSIRLIESLVSQGLFNSAHAQCVALLAEKGLTDVQRAKALTLQAEALLKLGLQQQGLALLDRVKLEHGNMIDMGKVNLLIARTKLSMDDDARVAEALALLEDMSAEHAITSTNMAARLELALFRLGQDLSKENTDAVKALLASNADLVEADRALRKMMEAYLELSQKNAPTVRTRESEIRLNDMDREALAAAKQLYSRHVRAAQSAELTGYLMTNLIEPYRDRFATVAAADGCKAILEMSLTPASQLRTMLALAEMQRSVASAELWDMVRADQQIGPEMPQAVLEALATVDAINAEFPGQGQDRKWALALKVREIGARFAHPAKVTELRHTDAWAFQVMLGVLAESGQRDVGQGGLAAWQLIDQYGNMDQLSAKQLAVGMADELLAAVPVELSPWMGIAWRTIELRARCAETQFRQNIADGLPQANAVLTEKQAELIDLMAAASTADRGEADRLLVRLAQHLTLWVQRGHYDVARAAYSRLAESLPLTAQQRAQLTTVRLIATEVQREFQRRLVAGQAVPTELDERLASAMLECYRLQAGLEGDDPFVAQVRGLSDNIVGIYLSLEMFDVAERALLLRPDTPAETPEVYLQFRLASLHDHLAGRGLVQALQQYEADRQVTITPAYEQALAEYTQFLLDHPDDPLIHRARASIYNIAGMFVGHKAYDVSAGVYRDFAAAAAKVPVFSAGTPDSMSVVQQAQLSAAGTLLAKARNALADAMADMPTPEPPKEISAEFAAAIAAYKQLLVAHPDTAMVASSALQQIMAVGLDYARVDAWDVAGSVYADVLASELNLHEPQRLKLLGGLCELGKVMPGHARQMLSALSAPTVPPQLLMRGLGDGGLSMLESTAPWHTFSAYPESWNDSAISISGREGRDESEDAVRLKMELPTASRPAAAPMRPADMAPYSDRADADGGMTLDAQGTGAGAYFISGPSGRAGEADQIAMAQIRQEHQQQASRVAQMRESQMHRTTIDTHANVRMGYAPPGQPILSAAELARQADAIGAAYAIFQAILAEYPHTTTARQARAEVLVMTNHWRQIAQWQRAAELTEKFLADNPADTHLPQLRLGIAMDYLAWAQQPVDGEMARHDMLAEVAKRFADARQRLGAVVETFAEEKAIVHQAQWQIAQSFLNQANAVEAFSPALARGQYVRASRELQAIATEYHDHPNIASVPSMVWNIASQLAGRGHYKDAITVWDQLRIHYPTHPLAQQAAMNVARAYQHNLRRPLMAAEAYLEINASRGGNDVGVQNEIFGIGSALRNEKRWVEALHVLETFVDTFPRHPSAGVALTMVGQIHQTNEAWEDAIAAYRRVIGEYDNGEWVRQAKWSIAECTINLSQWRQAISAYRTYQRSYPGDGRIGEAERRIGILKDLARYQALVDEDGQRKAFDAQYQIAEILATRLNNPVKAIIEYRKVTQNWPESHLADDALFKVGTTYRSVGDRDKARRALFAVATNYPTSPWADDALFIIGQMYETEARQLAAITREESLVEATEMAQQEAYGKWSADNKAMLAGQRSAVLQLKRAGDMDAAEFAEARNAAITSQSNISRARVLGEQAARQVEELTASQLADRQDKINAALREAVASYERAAKVPTADKADESLLRMAVIYGEQLKDPDRAMSTYREIVRQFSGTSVAEDASWRIAEYHDRLGEYEQAIEAYDAFLRNYRRSPKASDAQFAIAESYEQLDEWVKAMDAYTNYINNFPDGPKAAKAREQINWIRTYRL